MQRENKAHGNTRSWTSLFLVAPNARHPPKPDFFTSHRAQRTRTGNRGMNQLMWMERACTILMTLLQHQVLRSVALGVGMGIPSSSQHLRLMTYLIATQANQWMQSQLPSGPEGQHSSPPRTRKGSDKVIVHMARVEYVMYETSRKFMHKPKLMHPHYQGSTRGRFRIDER